jgi:hypothetical protein
MTKNTSVPAVSLLDVADADHVKVWQTARKLRRRHR